MNTCNNSDLSAILEKSTKIIEDIINNNKMSSRYDIARILCSKLGIINDNNKLKVTNILKQLNKLEEQGRIILPLPQSTKGRGDKLDIILDKVEEFPLISENNYDNLNIILAESGDEVKIWNSIFVKENKNLKFGIGKQFKYLIKIGDFYAGIACFSSANISNKERDQFIGWDRKKKKDIFT